MKILVTGSRDWSDSITIYKVLGYIAGSSEVTIIHGDCPTGADQIANHWAEAFVNKIVKFPADWDHYGRAAGPKRNKEMVESKPDICLAFIKNNSRGASNCANLARQAGILTLTVEQRD